MFIRQATSDDIQDLHSIRMSVRENILNTPGLVTEKDYQEHLESIGRGWICLVNNMVPAGFGIVNCRNSSIWALFVHPQFEGRGIGSRLQEVMLQHYFEKFDTPVWLITEKGTKAERFYQNSGWVKLGTTANGEMKFEMTKEIWNQRQGKVQARI